MASRLQELDELKEQLSAAITHDMRSPLNAISGMAQLLLDHSTDPLTEKQRRCLGFVLDGVTRLHALALRGRPGEGGLRCGRSARRLCDAWLRRPIDTAPVGLWRGPEGIRYNERSDAGSRRFCSLNEAVAGRVRDRHGDVSVTRSLVLLTRNAIETAPLVWGLIPVSAADEVLCVDDGSDDGTVQFVQLRGIRVVPQDRRGPGRGIQLAMREARGDDIVLHRIDGSQDPRDIPKLFARLDEDCDMVIASRRLPGGSSGEGGYLWRPRGWIERVVTMGTNLLFNRRRPWLTDATNSYRGVTKSALVRMGVDVDDFDVELALTIRGMKLGLRIAELPTCEGRLPSGDDTPGLCSMAARLLRRFLLEVRDG